MSRSKNYSPWACQPDKINIPPVYYYVRAPVVRIASDETDEGQHADHSVFNSLLKLHTPANKSIVYLFLFQFCIFVMFSVIVGT